MHQKILKRLPVVFITENHRHTKMQDATLGQGTRRKDSIALSHQKPTTSPHEFGPIQHSNITAKIHYNRT